MRKVLSRLRNHLQLSVVRRKRNEGLELFGCDPPTSTDLDELDVALIHEPVELSTGEREEAGCLLHGVYEFLWCIRCLIS